MHKLKRLLGALAAAALVAIAVPTVAAALHKPYAPALYPTAAEQAASSRIVSTTIAGQHTVIVEPAQPTTKAILFEHGSQATADSDIDDTPSATLIAAVENAGYAWAESDANFNNWGNARSLTDDQAVAVWLRSHGYTSLYLMGDSMGGLDVMQLIPKLHPKAAVALYPVCNEKTVEAIYGADIKHARAPVAKLSPVKITGASGLPMLFTASPKDTVVPKATNADVCAKEARADHAKVTEDTTIGEHGDPSNWVPSRIIRFLNAAG